MHRLIDYAGLFPPASLDLSTAVRKYSGYRKDEDRWMLGRFIIPAFRLEELAPFLRTITAEAGKPSDLAVLIGGGDAPEAAVRRAREESARISEFTGKHGEAVTVTVLETPLPTDLVSQSDGSAVAQYLEELNNALEPVPGDRDMYIEVPAGTEWEHQTERAIEGIDTFAGKLSAPGESAPTRAGLKLRCGGTNRPAFPPFAKIEFYLAASRDLRLPLKFTAGLHHPLPNLDRLTGASAHGFINVFTAGMLLHSGSIKTCTLQSCLEERRPDGFRFDSGTLTWQGYTVDSDTIASLRRNFLPGFGSCSFDEPREDLRSLGWLK